MFDSVNVRPVFNISSVNVRPLFNISSVNVIPMFKIGSVNVRLIFNYFNHYQDGANNFECTRFADA